MKNKIQIRNRFSGNVIFELETENNTMKKTVETYIENELDSGKSSANLSYADLRSANLRSADLSYADLSYAKNKETAYIPLNCKWGFSIKGDLIVIGCKEKTIEQWDGFFNSNDIYETRRGTEQFKQIEAVYKACKAYLQHLTAI